MGMGEKKTKYWWRGSRSDQKLAIKGVDPDHPEEITRLMPYTEPGEPPAGRPPNQIALSEGDIERLNLGDLVASKKLNERNGPPIRRSRQTEYRNFQG